jgi:ABC-type nitrate/sulfonate/bicarbonate transport system substrate-binding protein
MGAEIVQRKKWGIIGIIVIVLAFVLIGLVQYTNLPVNTAVPADRVTIGMNPAEYATLVFIAQDRGYFDARSLNVSIRNYGSGAMALTRMEAGDIDLALCAEYPVVSAAFRKDNISLISNIDLYQSGYLISRNDRKITDLPHPAFRTIGVEKGTLGEFRLSRFMDINGLEPQNTTVVNIPMSQSLESLANGSVDAVVILGNDLEPARKLVGTGLVAWRVDNRQQGYSLLAGRREWIDAHQGEVIRLLQGLDQASKYAADNPAEAKTIVKKRLNTTDRYIETIWPDHRFGLTLDQSLVLAMEDEARWMVRNNLTSEREIPNFLDYLDTREINLASPGSVHIIR